MQSLVGAAQRELDETGDLPAAIDTPAEITYERVSASEVRLCGTFQNASQGQAHAMPFFDVVVGLNQALTVPRSRPGSHCYNVALDTVDESARADAIVFRRMNAIATAVDCAFSASGVVPDAVEDAGPFVGRNAGLRLPPACSIINIDALTQSDISYAPTDDGIVRLCGLFQRGYDGSAPAGRIFHPQRDARFPELTAIRSETGLRCYDIQLRWPETSAAISAARWGDPIEMESLSGEHRREAEHDKREIGDVVNVLRLARCAYTMSRVAPETLPEAVALIAQRPGVADRYNCGWAAYYFSESRHAPVVGYERIDRANVTVCATFRRSWPTPLALNFYDEALTKWPTSLPELQRPVAEPGRHCYSAHLTSIGGRPN